MAAQLAGPDFDDRKKKFICEDREDSAVPTDLIHF